MCDKKKDFIRALNTEVKEIKMVIVKFMIKVRSRR